MTLDLVQRQGQASNAVCARTTFGCRRIKFRRFLPILALLCFALPVKATWTLVQHPNAPCASSPCAITVNSTGMGHIGIVGLMSYKSAVHISSVSGGGNWVHPSGCSAQTSDGTSTDLAYLWNETNGTTLISVTFSGKPGQGQIEYAEYSTTAPSTWFDGCGTNVINSDGTLPAGPSLTLSGSNDVIVEAAVCGGNNLNAITSPYTNPDDFPNSFGFAGAINQSTGAAPTWTCGTYRTAAVSAIAIKEEAGAASWLKSVWIWFISRIP
jgi:hypothetical protein